MLLHSKVRFTILPLLHYEWVGDSEQYFLFRVDSCIDLRSDQDVVGAILLFEREGIGQRWSALCKFCSAWLHSISLLLKSHKKLDHDCNRCAVLTIFMVRSPNSYVRGRGPVSSLVVFPELVEPLVWELLVRCTVNTLSLERRNAREFNLWTKARVIGRKLTW